MGRTVTDDLDNNKVIASDAAYKLSVTKFETDSKLVKAEFDISFETMKKIFGDRNMGWKTITKGADGKWA